MDPSRKKQQRLRWRPSTAELREMRRAAAGRQQLVREQQQRLLLLRHAEACTLVNGHCPAGYPQCPLFQALWPHLRECGRDRCGVEHCESSRYVLAHFEDCRERACAICGPVSEAIRHRRIVNGDRGLGRRAEGEGEGEEEDEEAALDREELEDYLDTAADNDLCCPIGLGLFREPVVFTDGHTYDRAHILRHIQSCAERKCVCICSWDGMWAVEWPTDQVIHTRLITITTTNNNRRPARHVAQDERGGHRADRPPQRARAQPRAGVQGAGHPRVAGDRGAGAEAGPGRAGAAGG